MGPRDSTKVAQQRESSARSSRILEHCRRNPSLVICESEPSPQIIYPMSIKPAPQVVPLLRYLPLEGGRLRQPTRATGPQVLASRARANQEADRDEA
jgi:hypothetical protein